MRRILTLVLLVLCAAMPTFAEMDLEAEKREAAQREAATQAAAAKQAEMQQKKDDARAKANAAMNKHLTDAQRKALGLPSPGSPTSK